MESLHEDSFLVQAMSLQRELGSPRIQPRNSIGGQVGHPIIYNHAALPQKQRNNHASNNKNGTGNN